MLSNRTLQRRAKYGIMSDYIVGGIDLIYTFTYPAEGPLLLMLRGGSALYEGLEKILRWSDIGYKALKYGMIAGAIAVGVYAFLGNPSTAKGELYNLSWHHWSPADFDGNFVVDYDDLGWLADHWLTPGDVSTEDYSGTDINKDGIVNFHDFAILANEFGRDIRDNDAKMSIRTLEVISEPGDEEHPYRDTYVGVKNRSPIDTTYEMDELIFGKGINQGINSQSYPTGWFSDYLTDPNQIRYWTNYAMYMIKPGEFENDFRVTVANPDPNLIKFENGKVNANTRYDEPFNYVIIRFPVLKE